MRFPQRGIVINCLINNMATRQSLIDKLRKSEEEIFKDDLVTTEEFSSFVKVITDFLKDMRSEMDELRDFIRNKNILLKEISDLKGGAEKTFLEVRKNTDEIVNNLKNRLTSLKDGYTPVKGKDYRDGRDADERRVAGLVASKIRKELDLLLELEDDINELKKLNYEVEELKRRPVQITGNTGRTLIREVDISSQLNGVLKTFNLGAFYRILTVDLSSFPHALRKTTDYTYDANAGTITFTSEIDAATSLASGQTCVITLIIN
jgi:hypothetical protein